MTTSAVPSELWSLKQYQDKKATVAHGQHSRQLMTAARLAACNLAGYSEQTTASELRQRLGEGAAGVEAQGRVEAAGVTAPGGTWYRDGEANLPQLQVLHDGIRSFLDVNRGREEELRRLTFRELLRNHPRQRTGKKRNVSGGLSERRTDRGLIDQNELKAIDLVGGLIVRGRGKAEWKATLSTVEDLLRLSPTQVAQLQKLLTTLPQQRFWSRYGVKCPPKLDQLVKDLVAYDREQRRVFEDDSSDHEEEGDEP